MNKINCPVCNKPLKTIHYQNQEVDLCLKCGGVWFDKGELLDVVNELLNEKTVEPQTIKEAYKATVFTSDSIDQLQRKCPRCSILMNLYNYAYDSNIFVDKCPKCNGIWTDEGEMKSIAKHIKGNPRIDSYAKALVCDITKSQKIGGNTGKIIAVVISILYLVTTGIFSGTEYLLRMILFLILPLACIFSAKEFGGLTGVRFRAGLSPVVTKPTPHGFIIFIGWILLFLPIIQIIIIIHGIRTQP